MSCLINEAFGLGCKDSIGGIKTVYLTNWEQFTGTTANSDQIITGITAGTFYEFKQTPQTAGYNENIEANLENGTVAHNQELVLVFNKFDYKLRNTVKLVSQGFVTALVVDNLNNIRLVGWERPLELTTSAGGTGLAFADRNGYSLTFTATQPEPAFVVDSSVLSLITIVTP